MIVVHGFVNATYEVVEDQLLDTLFQLNVKGITAFSGLNIEGTITAEAGGDTSELKDSRLPYIAISLQVKLTLNH